MSYGIDISKVVLLVCKQLAVTLMPKVGIVVAGRSGHLAAMAGMRLPIESHILQAFVTEGLKPCIDHVVSFGMGHLY